jgi:hypothetical protein
MLATTMTASSVVVNASVLLALDRYNDVGHRWWFALAKPTSTRCNATSTRLWAGYTFPFGSSGWLGYDNQAYCVCASGADQKRTA